MRFDFFATLTFKSLELLSRLTHMYTPAEVKEQNGQTPKDPERTPEGSKRTAEGSGGKAPEGVECTKVTSRKESFLRATRSRGQGG